MVETNLGMPGLKFFTKQSGEANPLMHEFDQAHRLWLAVPTFPGSGNVKGVANLALAASGRLGYKNQQSPANDHQMIINEHYCWGSSIIMCGFLGENPRAINCKPIVAS